LQYGYYYIKIKNNSGCQSDTQYVYVEYPPYIPAAPTVLTVKPTDCGTKNGSITVTSYATSYSFDDGITWGTNATLNALDAGTYLIKIKDSYGGCSSLATTVVLNAVNNTLAAPTYTITQPTCTVNGSITITTAAAQYSFDNGVTFVTSNSKSNLLPGTYFIKIKNNLGCVSASNSVVINAAPIPAAPVFNTIQPNCITQTGSITITTVAAEYSFDNGLTFTTSNTRSSLSSGTYLLQTKNSAGCISNSASANISIVPAIPNQPSITVSQPLSCTTITGSISVTTPAAQYSFDNGVTWGSNSISPQLNPGSYFVKIKQIIGGCESIATNAIINAPPNAPNIPLVSTIQPTTCANPFGSITITSTAFAYSFNNGLTYSSNASSGLLTAGTYQLKVKNSSNCESDVLVVKINAPLDYPNPPLFNIQQPDCSNPKGIITITSIASEYSFDDGLTWGNSPVSTYLNSGNHLLKIKNSIGCISEASTANIIPFTNFPPHPTVSTPQTFCIQENATLNNLIATGQNIKWYDSSGMFLSNATVLQNNTTYYASQSINGCESQKEPVLVNIQNTAAPSGNPAQSLCTSQNPILSAIAITGTGIKWYDSSGILLADTTPLQNGATYYATQTVNGCESIGKFAVTISLITTLPASNFEQSFCDDLNDGNEIIDLSSFNANLISIPTNYNFVYYTSLSGAENEITSDAITSFLNYKLNVGTHKIYVRINTNNPCYAIAELKLNLISKPVIPIQDIVPICENNIITIDAGPGFSSYLWSTGETTQSIIVSKPGNFSVIVTTNYATISCSNTKNFIVKNSTVATITKIETKDWTDNDNIITVFVTGQGDYEYTIDGKNYQDSNQFLALHSGEYAVTVKDKNGCGMDTEEVYLLMYPKFFTPNGDGYNDTWKIKFSDLETGLTVKIVDRFGKFIKELPTNTDAWDGTYNGYQLPATDYWFIVTRTNGKEYKGHFSLKR
jgi:large repetitive protein